MQNIHLKVVLAREHLARCVKQFALTGAEVVRIENELPKASWDLQVCQGGADSLRHRERSACQKLLPVREKRVADLTAQLEAAKADLAGKADLVKQAKAKCRELDKIVSEEIKAAMQLHARAEHQLHKALHRVCILERKLQAGFFELFSAKLTALTYSPEADRLEFADRRIPGIERTQVELAWARANVEAHRLAVDQAKSTRQQLAKLIKENIEAAKSHFNHCEAELDMANKRAEGLIEEVRKILFHTWKACANSQVIHKAKAEVSTRHHELELALATWEDQERVLKANVDHLRAHIEKHERELWIAEETIGELKEALRSRASEEQATKLVRQLLVAKARARASKRRLDIAWETCEELHGPIEANIEQCYLYLARCRRALNLASNRFADLEHQLEMARSQYDISREIDDTDALVSARDRLENARHGYHWDKEPFWISRDGLSIYGQHGYDQAVYRHDAGKDLASTYDRITKIQASAFEAYKEVKFLYEIMKMAKAKWREVVRMKGRREVVTVGG
jgi:hypothetical protein